MGRTSRFRVPSESKRNLRRGFTLRDLPTGGERKKSPDKTSGTESEGVSYPGGSFTGRRKKDLVRHSHGSRLIQINDSPLKRNPSHPI